MINLYGLELKKLQDLLKTYDQKPYRAIQLYTWIYEKHVTSFDEMSDVSIKFREVLNRDFEENENIYEVMCMIGRKRGCIVSGGNIDDEKVANIILDDFRTCKLGKITLEKIE